MLRFNEKLGWIWLYRGVLGTITVWRALSEPSSVYRNLEGKHLEFHLTRLIHYIVLYTRRLE